MSGLPPASWSWITSTGIAIFFPTIAFAQPIIPDDSTQTDIILNGDRIDIQGGQTSDDGANLFHSFQEFGLDTGQTANFLSSPDIQNIFGRVTGGNASFIDGLIQVTGSSANLFLMNPAGIVFGENARLDVPASFTATTATGIGFEGGWFHAMTPNNYTDLVGTPNTFDFATPTPGSIVNYGNLSVGTGANLHLFGGTVVSQGNLVADGGNISIAAVAGDSPVRLRLEGNILALEVSPTTASFSLFNPRSLPELLTLGKSLDHADTVTVNSDGTVALKGSDVRIEVGDIVTSSISSNGGAIVLNSTGEIAITETLDSSAAVENGGAVTLQALGDLSTDDVNASSIQGDGGEVFLFNQTGNIATGNIDTSSEEGNGGRIELMAGGSITTEDLNASSNQGNAAGVILSSPTEQIATGNIDAAYEDRGDRLPLLEANPPSPPAPPEPPIVLDLPTTLAFNFANADRLEIHNSNPTVGRGLPVLAREAGTCLQMSGLLDSEVGRETTAVSGDRAEAIACYQTNLKFARESGDLPRERYTLYNLAISYYAIGDYATALEYHQQRLELARSLGDLLEQGAVWKGIGDTYGAIGQFDRAVEAYDRGLEIARSLESQALEGNILRNLGLVYYALEDYETALDLQRQSLEFALQEGNSIAEKRRQQVARGNALNNLGLTHYKLTDYKTALELQEQSLAIARELGDRTAVGRALENLGLVYYAREDYERAIDYHQQSLALARETGDRHGIARALNNLGDALNRAGRPSEAIDTLLRAIETWESLRENLGDRDLDRVAIFETQETTYSTLQEILVEQNQFETALEITERGRARAFVELLARRQGNSAKLPQVHPPNIAQIRAIAREQNATLVSYSIVQDVVEIEGVRQLQDKELYIWVVQPTQELAFRRIDLESVVAEWGSLKKLAMDSRCFNIPCLRRKGVTLNDWPIDAESERILNRDLQQLYQLAIEPIADLLPDNPEERVIFIPHRSMFLMPFPALQDPSGQYLIERQTISTAPSIQVLSLTHQQQQNNAGRKFGEALVVGNPTMPAVTFSAGGSPYPLEPLPGAESEAIAIAEMLGTEAITGDGATEEAIVDRMSRSRIVHLATHGLLEDFEGLGLPGAIALTPSDGADGLLSAGEIFDLDLSTQLVVLSACHTGQGRISEDGVLGLSRSFMAAGVPSLVVSLWAVPDAPTADLMVELYRQLDRNPDKARALRQAMLRTLDKYPSPENWAAFTLMGES